MEVLVCRRRAVTLSLRALTSLTQPALLSVAIWSRVLLSPALPPSHSTVGESTVESLGLSAPQGKGEARRRKVGEEGGRV